MGAVPDRIEVRGLRVEGIHGVLEHERVRAQPFEVDLDLYVDVGSAITSDDVADTADYGAAVDAAVAVITGPPHRLLESLAGAIADGVLQDPRVDGVTVTIRKLRPPLSPAVASTGVRIHRRRAFDSGPDGPDGYAPGERS